MSATANVILRLSWVLEVKSLVLFAFMFYKWPICPTRTYSWLSCRSMIIPDYMKDISYRWMYMIRLLMLVAKIVIPGNLPACKAAWSVLFFFSWKRFWKVLLVFQRCSHLSLQNNFDVISTHFTMTTRANDHWLTQKIAASRSILYILS